MTQFFSKLSQNYVELLNDNEYYDVTIEVDNSNIKLPNISFEIFKIVLRYIYGGILLLNERDTLDIFKILLAADELLLHEIVDYLQKYLIENKTEWLEQNFGLIYQTRFQTDSLVEIQKFCTNFMIKSPEKIFKSLDFTSLPENFLVQLVKRDDIQMKEIEIWEHLLEWGLAQNLTLKPDPNTWLDDDFKSMENTLQLCLPSIRFFSLSSKEFLNKVKPYKKLLKYQFYEDLINSYMNPDSKPNESILPPRNIKFNGIIDSKIINLNIVSVLSRWIDKTDRIIFSIQI
uniref:BTB domain-containing protein n=1 Tax=Rhizophagus irregularis (strain DAOM 181602 / DAOM 197198 / MUCL 43194) TaxID=747089 RepID=U9UFP5_RHIID